MRSFVKTSNGTFPNVNFYLAWEAFNTLGYSVTCFEEKDIGTLEVTPTTPLFAGVRIFRKVIDKMGVNYPPFDCYPQFTDFSGQNFYGRTLRKSTVGEERKKFLKDGVSIFVKPIEPKKFLGHVWSSMINLIPITNIADETPCWVCEPMEIFSEHRCYVNDGEILGVKHYFGDWSIIPDKMFIEEVVERYVDCPVAYGIDFAVVADGDKYKTIVMEVNDGCNLGNYGLDSIHYGEMIIARWFEIMEKGGKGEGLRTESLKNYAAEIYEKVTMKV